MNNQSCRIREVPFGGSNLFLLLALTGEQRGRCVTKAFVGGDIAMMGDFMMVEQPQNCYRIRQSSDLASRNAPMGRML